jgi:hypothetical protein
MHRSSLFVFYLLALAAPIRAAELDFAHDIAPLIRKHCGECHTGNQKKGSFSLNTRETLLKGGESGPVVVAGKSGKSELIARVASEDKDLRMPPEGPRLSAEQVTLLKSWIDAGLPWEQGFTFGRRSYEPPLKPRRVELPPAVAGRTNPVDRIIDAYQANKQVERPHLIDDASFLRRASLDIVGLLPTPEEFTAFLADKQADKRSRKVRELLDRDVEYAEHWLTFWNDLLRNDYTGTGFITGGRKQITRWLYDSLINNKPYDQFARELIAPPTPDSAGFIDGIRWRGEVSAGQTVEIQFAQSVGQSLLGINLKCASCHDSFIDRWTLAESYGLAAIYSSQPLAIHRCDKPIGQMAQASWLFPEIGQVDANAAQPERLKQLAALMTHPENGRFTRTIVNRIWHRLMGRGIVHPVDAMQSEPWNSDLLDYLAMHLADNKYDLKKTIELIARSAAYQSRAEVVADETADYVFRGPRAKRLTAEQFVDAVWQLTGTAPTSFDAQVVRGTASEQSAAATKLTGQWIWSSDIPPGKLPPGGQTITVRKQFKLAAAPQRAGCVITCDNEYILYVNGKRVAADTNWETVEAASVTEVLKSGENEILIQARNGAADPNPAAVYFEAVIETDGKGQNIATDKSWQWTAKTPDPNGKFAEPPKDWRDVSVVSGPWGERLAGELQAKLSPTSQTGQRMVRASLTKNNFLMRSLGRPHREQIVTQRPTDLTTLEAMDLSNGETLAELLSRGAKQLLQRQWKSPAEFVHWLYLAALIREPSQAETATLQEILGDKLTAQGIEDALWAVLMLPEFQLVR